MKMKAFIVGAGLLFASVFVINAQQFKDVLKAITDSASNNYHAESHYGEQTGYYVYSPPPSEADNAMRNQHAYDVGYRVGHDDYHHHLSKHFTRHPDLYDQATHDAFAGGYESGYDRAREESASRLHDYRPPAVYRESVKSENYPSGYYPYTPPHPDQSDTDRNRHAYEVGYKVGQDDFDHGHSKHFTRHEKLFDKGTHDSFGRGYGAGYDKARDRSKR